MKRDINMSLRWSSEYFMLMELLTYRFSEAKCRCQSFVFDQTGRVSGKRLG